MWQLASSSQVTLTSKPIEWGNAAACRCNSGHPVLLSSPWNPNSPHGHTPSNRDSSSKLESQFKTFREIGLISPTSNPAPEVVLPEEETALIRENVRILTLQVNIWGDLAEWRQDLLNILVNAQLVEDVDIDVNACESSRKSHRTLLIIGVTYLLKNFHTFFSHSQFSFPSQKNISSILFPLLKSK